MSLCPVRRWSAVDQKAILFVIVIALMTSVLC